MKHPIRPCIAAALAAIVLSGCAVVKPIALPVTLPAAAVRALLPGSGSTSTPSVPIAEPTPPGYVIGPEDVLNIIFWRDAELTREVVVRPDGKISLPLLNDVQAAGYTPEELRTQLIESASAVMEQPSVTVVVREINSRRVYITGNISQPGTHQLASGMTVLQLIAVAGGLAEYADKEKILIVRPETDRTRYFRFNYKDVIKQKNLQQNITLQSGDTVVVP